MNSIDIRSVIKDYFDNPIFTKIENKNNFSIYYCKTGSLSNLNRYAIAFVNQDAFFPGYEIPLNLLRWTVFQTRSIPLKHNIRLHYYKPKQGKYFDGTIEMIGKTTESCTYRSLDFPGVSITLLNDDTNMYEYPQKGTLNSALETYNTVIVID